MKTTVCQLCDSKKLDIIIDLGHHPLADSFLNESQVTEALAMYPLQVVLCRSCGHAMLGYVVSPEERYQKIDYSYTASNSKVSISHFQEIAEAVSLKIGLGKNDIVVDIGSNDGTLLTSFKNISGCKIIGVEPSSNIAKISRKNGIPTIQDFFNTTSIKRILAKGKVKVITATNVFNHISDLKNFMKDIVRLLDTEGVFVFEVPYFPDMIVKGAFDTIYLEHISYFNAKPFEKFFKRYGMYIQHMEQNEYMGGSVRVYVSKKKPKTQVIIKEFIIRENEDGIYDLNTYYTFMSRIADFKYHLNLDLYQAKIKGEKIIGIGAATKGNTLLNYCKIDSSVIDFITDSSHLKIGKYAPGSSIPIRPDADITADIGYALILPWNIADFLVSKLSHLKLKFIIPRMK